MLASKEGQTRVVKVKPFSEFVFCENMRYIYEGFSHVSCKDQARRRYGFYEIIFGVCVVDTYWPGIQH